MWQDILNIASYPYSHLFVVDEILFILCVTSPATHAAPPDGNNVGVIAGAVAGAAVGIVSIIVIIIVVIVMRSHRAQFDLRKKDR